MPSELRKVEKLAIRKMMEGKTNDLKDIKVKNPHNGKWEALTSSWESDIYYKTSDLREKDLEMEKRSMISQEEEGIINQLQDILSNSAPDMLTSRNWLKSSDEDGTTQQFRDNDDMIELWHKRLGHMSEKGMSILSKKNVLSGVHDINLKKCSHYLAGKQTRGAFKSRSVLGRRNILDLYFRFERQTGKKLKCIRSDNGGEYIGPFDAYCREHGIQHQKTPPKTPQLNGLAERMNRTLVERVKCLLSHAGLPASFWGEALNTAVHVINLTPCVPLRFDVPDRVWSGKDVSYHHLRVFGCKASVHIPKDERSKLDVKNKPCVFLGYGQDELDPVPPKHFDAQFGDDILNDKEQNDEEHGTDDVDAQEQPNLDEDVHPELPVLMPQFVPLWRSTRDHHPSTRYSANEYVFLTDGGEPECYAEAMEDEHKKEWLTDKDYPSSKKNIEKMDKVPYASAVGSLMYAMVCTRPDLANKVGVVSRFLSNPGKKHWEAVKWIFRYLRGGAVSWQSRLQKCVALSTTKAEYMAATEACKELLWLKRFFQELGFKQQRYAVLCDNQSTSPPRRRFDVP
ncbi:putative RNA-directed DNA polymerase [Tanacetum coccineum]